MPRPRKPGAPEPKRRSRTGCWPCKTRKVKCGEEKPSCVNCVRRGEPCDYSVRLNWCGRSKNPPPNAPSNPSSDLFRVVLTGIPDRPLGQTVDAGVRSDFDDDGGYRLSARASKRIKLTSPPPERRAADADGCNHPAASYDSNAANHGQAWTEQDVPPLATQLSDYITGTDGSPTTGGFHDTSLDTRPQRVSVQSLLSQPAAGRSFLVKSPASGPPDGDHYGYDCGRWDLDLNTNDDSTAIQREMSDDPISSDPESETAKSRPPDQANALTAFAKGGYYARPVPISIPRHLSPLPPALHENPIHLLYFHHFTNHTAKILVPHACTNNPFENVLPAMAVRDENVLSMLFAYSASHRARLLGHAEPCCRIAHWTRDVFTNLRRSLESADPRISDTSLAAAIMLVSLKIISPTTFEAPISWQSHLKLARELFAARINTQRISAADKVGSFLGRWLGYLDIMGSLSSRDTGAPLFGGNYWSTESASIGPSGLDEGDMEVDCFTGFTPRCRRLLARLAELMHECDLQRYNSVHRISPSSELPAVLLGQAEQLLGDFKVLGSPEVVACRSHHGVDNNDIDAVDDAYRLAGLVQLCRRVLGPHPSWECEARDAVDALLAALDRVPCGGSAEVCCLFPLFTAGCETGDQGQRQQICSRVKSFEGVGMKQIRSARKLMQRTWQEGLSWTDLASGEFLG